MACSSMDSDTTQKLNYRRCERIGSFLKDYIYVNCMIMPLSESYSAHRYDGSVGKAGC
jgi:hypothetical protein